MIDAVAQMLAAQELAAWCRIGSWRCSSSRSLGLLAVTRRY
jgi:hypothetical protein